MDNYSTQIDPQTASVVLKNKIIQGTISLYFNMSLTFSKPFQ